MKFTTFFISLLVSTSLFAADKFKEYEVPGEGKGFVSVEKFETVESAVEFCADNNSEMIEDERMVELVLYWAMSGIAANDPFLLEALEFELKSETEEISGVWFWSRDQKSVGLWYNGKGFTMDMFPVAELNERFPKNDIALPAICELKQ